MNNENQTTDIVDDKLPIVWAVVEDPTIEGYKVFDERITPVTAENHQRVEALNGLLTVLTKEHKE